MVIDRWPIDWAASPSDRRARFRHLSKIERTGLRRHERVRAHTCIANLRKCSMNKGTVKWFNSQKGFGFIQPEDGGKDVFVHISAVERAGLPGLNDGQAIEYEEVSNRGKTSAYCSNKFSRAQEAVKAGSTSRCSL